MKKSSERIRWPRRFSCDDVTRNRMKYPPNRVEASQPSFADSAAHSRSRVGRNAFSPVSETDSKGPFLEGETPDEPAFFSVPSGFALRVCPERNRDVESGKKDWLRVCKKPVPFPGQSHCRTEAWGQALRLPPPPPSRRISGFQKPLFFPSSMLFVGQFSTGSADGFLRERLPFERVRLSRANSLLAPKQHEKSSQERCTSRHLRS